MKAATLLLFLSAFVLQSDQNLLAPHLTAVAKELGLSDEQRDAKLGGDLALGLFLLGAPCAIFIGSLGDRWRRRDLLAGISLLGGIASAGTATATTFMELFWWRALTGVSLGSALPLTFSLLGDLYGPSLRQSERLDGHGRGTRRRTTRASGRGTGGARRSSSSRQSLPYSPSP